MQTNNILRILFYTLLLISILNCKDGINDPVQDEDTTPILALPIRSVSASSGTEVVDLLATRNLEEREYQIWEEIQSGNLPLFLHQFVPVNFHVQLNDETYFVTLYVLPDYIALGSDTDYFYCPMTPILAQKIADSLGCSLPTRKIVDQIWEQAPLKLTPAPIPPSDIMTTIPVFFQHSNMIHSQRDSYLDEFPLGTLVGGHKKDVIVSNRIFNNQSKVVIYGWHQPDGNPIQPLYAGHANWYADYSHGIRLIHNRCIVNGSTTTVKEILVDQTLYALLSDEDGPMQLTDYPTDNFIYP